jgi:hypothetical protein
MPYKHWSMCISGEIFHRHFHIYVEKDRYALCEVSDCCRSRLLLGRRKPEYGMESSHVESQSGGYHKLVGDFSSAKWQTRIVMMS